MEEIKGTQTNNFQKNNGQSRWNRWERLITLGDTFIARSGQTAILDQSETLIYVYGGFTGQEVLSDISIFNLVDNSWIILPMSEE
jgi:hypothetical protein